MSEWASFLQLFHLSGWILPSEYLLNASQSHPHSWQFAAFWTSSVGHHQHHLLDQAPESPPSYLLPHSSSAELTRLLTTINTWTIMSSLEESICNILNQFNHQESERSSSACTRTRFLFLCSSLQNTSWWPEHTSNSSTWFKRKYNNLNVRHLNDIVIVVLFKNTTNEQCTTHVYLQNKTDKSKNHSGNGAVHKFCPKI